MGSTHRLHLKLLFLSEVEVSGIPGVAVKCVEIRRNIYAKFWFNEDLYPKYDWTASGEAGETSIKVIFCFHIKMIPESVNHFIISIFIMMPC